MITIEQYVGLWANSPDWNLERKNNAVKLLEACNKLEAYAVKDGVEFKINPITNSNVSGTKYGGFRPQDCSEGAPDSAHKQGQAVDRFDPKGLIDSWCMKNQDKLVECGIYIEHPSTTPNWSHWSTRSPHSGKHVFYP